MTDKEIERIKEFMATAKNPVIVINPNNLSLVNNLSIKVKSNHYMPMDKFVLMDEIKITLP